MLIPRLYVDVLPPTLYTGYACNTSGLKFSPGHGGRKINHRCSQGDTGFEGRGKKFVINFTRLTGFEGFESLVLLFDFVVNMGYCAELVWSVVGKDFDETSVFLNPFDFSSLKFEGRIKGGKREG